MSRHDWLDGEQAHEDESFGRPFLGKMIHAEANDPRDGTGVEPVVGNNRPYLMTGGRTGGGAAGIGIETILVRDHTVTRFPRLTSELTMIIHACATPVAVAEVAARTRLPIGVVQVLAGDLVSANVLLRSMASVSQADDVVLLERLIHGVAAL